MASFPKFWNVKATSRTFTNNWCTTLPTVCALYLNCEAFYQQAIETPKPSSRDTMSTEDVVHADPNDVGMYEIESLCMNCEDNVGLKIESTIFY